MATTIITSSGDKRVVNYGNSGDTRFNQKLEGASIRKNNGIFQLKMPKAGVIAEFSVSEVTINGVSYTSESALTSDLDTLFFLVSGDGNFAPATVSDYTPAPGTVSNGDTLQGAIEKIDANASAAATAASGAVKRSGSTTGNNVSVWNGNDADSIKNSTMIWSAGTNFLGLGGITASSTGVAFDGQSGSIKIGGIQMNWTSRNSNFTVSSIRYAILMDASGGARTVTLTSGSANTQRFMIINASVSGTNAVTVAATGTDTIGGLTQILLRKIGDFIIVESEGTAVGGIINYRVVGGNVMPYDIEIPVIGKGLIMPSPNGTRWRLTPSDAGAAVFTSL